MVFNQYHLDQCNDDYHVLWYNNNTNLFELTTYGIRHYSDDYCNYSSDGLTFGGDNINELVSIALKKYREYNEDWRHECSRMDQVINKNLKKIEEIQTEFPSIEVNDNSEFIYLNHNDLIVGNQLYMITHYYQFEIMTIKRVTLRNGFYGPVYDVIARDSKGRVDTYCISLRNREWAADLNTLKYNSLVNLISDISDGRFTLESYANRYKNYLINLNFLNNLQNGKSS